MLKDVPVFISFSVNDIQAAKAFYGQTLGLMVSDSSKNVLRLDLVDSNSVTIYQKYDHVPSNFTLMNFQVINIAQMVDELTAKGVVFEHYSTGDYITNDKGISSQGPVSLAWFKDPAGNTHSLMEGM